MRKDAAVYLMYHELEVNGRPVSQTEQGYIRYVVRGSDFGEQIKWLKSSGMQGISVTAALGKKPPQAIVITFDDGCESDLTVAAPILREANFGGTFYITVGFLGRAGHLFPCQVRELSDAGFEIGSHSMTHPYLDSLQRQDLLREIGESKNQLEQMTGKAVHHFSCPGGRWSRDVSTAAREAGYKTVATSHIAANDSRTDPFCLSRIVVMRDLNLAGFEDICRGRRLWRSQLGGFVRTKSRNLLGNTLYDRVRSAILER